MDLAVFYQVIVPLLKVRGTAIICISTPLSSWCVRAPAQLCRAAA